jgi:hypothetical protein
MHILPSRNWTDLNKKNWRPIYGTFLRHLLHSDLGFGISGSKCIYPCQKNWKKNQVQTTVKLRYVPETCASFRPRIRNQRVEIPIPPSRSVTSAADSTTCILHHPFFITHAWSNLIRSPRGVPYICYVGRKVWIGLLPSVLDCSAL